MKEMAFYQPKLPPPELDKPLLSESVDFQGGSAIRTPNWLGDNLICMSSLYRLRRELGEKTELIIYCRSQFRPLWEMASWVGKIIDFPNKRAERQHKESLARLNPGVGLVLPNSTGAAYDFVGTGIPIRIGRRGRGRTLLLSHRLPRWRKRFRNASFHQASHYFELAGSIIKLERRFPEKPILKLEPGFIKKVEKKFNLLDSYPTLAIAPGGAYGPAKQWPIENFRQIAEWANSVGIQVCILGTEKEKAAGEVICHELKGAENLSGDTTLQEAAALLKSSDVVLANDSGIMHLAAALGCSGTAIFGSTCPTATGPVGGRWAVLNGGEACSCAPCFQRNCGEREKNYACLQAITPEAVRKTLEQML